jgi:RNA polymerase sigma-70 factor, ECF subfamily
MGSGAKQVKAKRRDCASLREALSSPREGDSEGFDLLYQQYSTLVRAVCLRMLRDSADAEDAAQDVFVRVLRKIHTFRGDSTLSTWLYRVTVNTVLMRIRKRRRDGVAPSELQRDEGDAARCTSPQAPLLNTVSRWIDLQAALNCLSDSCKVVFILHDIQGYGHREISGLLGRSIGNSKSQLHRARKRLRKLLGDTRKRTAGDVSDGARQQNPFCLIEGVKV